MSLRNGVAAKAEYTSGASEMETILATSSANMSVLLLTLKCCGFAAAFSQ